MKPPSWCVKFVLRLNSISVSFLETQTGVRTQALLLCLPHVQPGARYFLEPPSSHPYTELVEAALRSWQEI